MKSATYARRVEKSREIVGVSTVTFGSKNEPTPCTLTAWAGARISAQWSNNVQWQPTLWGGIGGGICRNTEIKYL